MIHRKYMPTSSSALGLSTSEQSTYRLYQIASLLSLPSNASDLGEFMKDLTSAVEGVNSKLVKSFEEIQQMFDDLVSGIRMDLGVRNNPIWQEDQSQFADD